jgi:hypothetical protein
MGIRSWFRSRRAPDDPGDELPDDPGELLDDPGEPTSGGHSLIKYRYEDPAFEPIEEAAAADVARVEEDAKYFGPNSPVEADEL